MLHLTPLIYYSYFAIASGFLICVLVYQLCRAHLIKMFPSLLATLAVPYIANGGNLPGIWYFLPYIAGTIFLLVMLIAYQKEEKGLSLVCGGIAVILYPPIITFVLPLFLFLKRRGGIAFISLAILLIILKVLSNIQGGVFARLVSFIIRDSTTRGIVSFHLWHVFPYVLLPFLIIGIIRLVVNKKYFFITPISIGFIFWIIYTFFNKVILITHSRIVIITSILSIVCIAYGFEAVAKKLITKYPFIITKYKTISMYGVLGIFIILSFFYPQFNPWREMILINRDDTVPVVIDPLPPITRYLTQDDLRLFKSIKKSKFIAPAWKGLVIGVATHNYPLQSKAATITVNKLEYMHFMASNCQEKKALARNFSIRYVYSSPFQCEGFTAIGASRENLVLYNYYLDKLGE